MIYVLNSITYNIISFLIGSLCIYGINNIIKKYKQQLPLIIPNHIGIIMDGNGRWATNRKLLRSQGHLQGTYEIFNLVTESIKLKIKFITLLCLSTANLKRPIDEVNNLYSIMESFIRNNTDWFIQNNVKIMIIGNTNILPITLQNVINLLVCKTKELNDITLILAINYDSRTEICDAINKYSMDTNIDKGNITWNVLNRYLYTCNIPDPDLIIRTSGEYRISNFLLMQSANAEYIFLPILWPDFKTKHLIYCITEYSKRDRRFGMTSEQKNTI
jgi:undecaprenyl diphosphate synthase